MRTLGFLLSLAATIFFMIQGVTYYDVPDEGSLALVIAVLFAFSTGFCLASLVKAIGNKRQVNRNIERLLA